MPLYDSANPDHVRDIKEVWVDDCIVENVIRCHTEDGWAEVNTGKVEGGEWVVEKLTGKVEVVMKWEKDHG